MQSTMFAIDRYSPTPIYEQLTAQFERLILLGLLAPNAALPSVRALSQELSINPNTVQKAYADLERRGLAADGVPQEKASQALAEGYEVYQTKGEKAV